MDAVEGSGRNMAEEVNFLPPDLTILQLFHKPNQLPCRIPRVGEEPEVEVVTEVRVQGDYFQGRRYRYSVESSVTNLRGENYVALSSSGSRREFSQVALE